MLSGKREFEVANEPTMLTDGCYDFQTPQVNLIPNLSLWFAGI